MTRSLRVAVTGAVIFLIQASVPAYAQSSKPEAAIGNASYMVMATPIGITPAQVARFNVSILASKGSAADFQGGCSWAGFIWFYDENDKTVGSPTTFTMKSEESRHGDLDGAVTPNGNDQYGRKQVRPVAVFFEPDNGSRGKCAALVGASFEVFDKQTGATVTTLDNFFIAPVDRAEPPPSPIEPGSSTRRQE